MYQKDKKEGKWLQVEAKKKAEEERSRAEAEYYQEGPGILSKMLRNPCSEGV